MFYQCFNTVFIDASSGHKISSSYCDTDKLIIIFNNLSSPGNYVWDFGDPGSGSVNNSTLTDPAHVYVNLGPYNVKLEATTAHGCIHDTTIVLNTIHPQPQASFTTDFIDVCIGSPFLFTSTSNGADGTISQYQWNMGDGAVRTLGSFSYTYADTGTYQVSHFKIGRAHV